MDLKLFLRPGGGACDITPLLANKEAFSELVQRLADLFSNETIDVVACVEGRGFIIGGAVAAKINAGLVPLRYPGKLKNEVYSEKFIDYSGKEKELQIHKDAFSGGKNVLILDDWVETGATFRAAINLISLAGGNIVGIGTFMDDSKEETKEWLAKYNYKFLERVTSGDKF